MSRLLILSCSQRKRLDADLLPAIERYDGPAFRLLRRYLRQNPADPPTTYILSAEFGLIPADQPIPWYDRRMTAERARELRPAVADALGVLCEPGLPGEALLVMGRPYLDALGDFVQCAPPRRQVMMAAGTPGAKLSRLHDWLYGASSPLRRQTHQLARPRTACLRSAPAPPLPEALTVARHALRAGTGDPDRYQAWYVPIDGRRVAVKWLAGCLTSLPVGRFTTGEARIFLSRVGFEVRRA